jgi:high potential iron-sulfur protein
MEATATPVSRRALLARGASLLMGLMVVPGFTHSVLAKGGKSDFSYQDEPHEGKRCADCQFFTVDSNSQDIGTCALVAGVIKRNGWCSLFSPRS